MFAYRAISNPAQQHVCWSLKLENQKDFPALAWQTAGS